MPSTPDQSNFPLPADPTPGPPGPATRHPRPLGGDTARSIGKGAVSLTGMVLNNTDGQIHHARLERKPSWIRSRAPGGAEYEDLRSIIQQHGLHTVCQEASCPNMGECWAERSATILILGNICTRSCGFCNVLTGKPLPPDLDEPRRVAESLSKVGLKHVVITSVDRDDLPDGGAAIWAETIRQCRRLCPKMTIEVLVGDFRGEPEALDLVIAAAPDVLAHNMETVRRMHPAVRPQAKYQRSLDVLRRIRRGGLIAKTGIMVGIGEHDEEVLDLMDDVQSQARTHILTIGQYLQPTRNHLPVDRWVTPAQFDLFKNEGLGRGFRIVESGPLVRSSYRAGDQAATLLAERDGKPSDDGAGST